MARDHRARGAAARGPPAKSGSERSRLRRDKPLTWRSALWLLIPVFLLAAGSDAALIHAFGQRCPRCGGIHVPLELLFASVCFTGVAVGMLVVVWRGTRKSSHAPPGLPSRTKPLARRG